MRYASEHNEEARARILEAASRLFREHGVEGVGLAKIMAEADLTVGTFYTHFPFGDLEPECPQFAVHARCAPCRILGRQPPHDHGGC